VKELNKKNSSMKKEKRRRTIIPIAMMFLVIGLTFDHTRWLQYTFVLSSIILCLVSLGLSIKEKKEAE
jgi:Mn2+/Fe2+ NRAMP family transporter